MNESKFGDFIIVYVFNFHPSLDNVFAILLFRSVIMHWKALVQMLLREQSTRVAAAHQDKIMLQSSWATSFRDEFLRSLIPSAREKKCFSLPLPR